MKLSDVKGERILDVVADIIESVANIAADKEASELFTRKPLPEGMTANEFMLRRLRTSLPVLLKAHKSDIITILSAIKGVSPEEYAESLNLSVLFADMAELITDKDFAVLFTSAQNRTSSGSASENTQESKEQKRSANIAWQDTGSNSVTKYIPPSL
ncbi:MAG: hypothetical protein NC320_09090 [Clostridium sp.]|nr:hypothetical protein [Clostridium sp.]MCM1547918.1 hypothetical protein [Ruminococcus sp.]